MSSSANRRRVAGQRRRPRATQESTQDAAPDSARGDEGLRAQEGAAADPPTRPEDPTALDEATTSPPSARDEAQPAPALPAETVGDIAPSATEADGIPAHSGDEPKSVRAPSRLEVVVAAVALVLAGAMLAALLIVTRDDPGERAAQADAAVATARSSIETLLSYNYQTLAEQLPQNQELLTGNFKEEFGTTVTDTIVPLATKEKTIVEARVFEAGVMSQADGSVRVQAFVNQATTKEAQPDPSVDQNRVIATMRKEGNTWLISELSAY